MAKEARMIKVSEKQNVVSEVLTAKTEDGLFELAFVETSNASGELQTWAKLAQLKVQKKVRMASDNAGFSERSVLMTVAGKPNIAMLENFVDLIKNFGFGLKKTTSNAPIIGEEEISYINLGKTQEEKDLRRESVIKRQLGTKLQIDGNGEALHAKVEFMMDHEDEFVDNGVVRHEHMRDICSKVDRARCSESLNEFLDGSDDEDITGANNENNNTGKDQA